MRQAGREELTEYADRRMEGATMDADNCAISGFSALADRQMTLATSLFAGN